MIHNLEVALETNLSHTQQARLLGNAEHGIASLAKNTLLCSGNLSVKMLVPCLVAHTNKTEIAVIFKHQ